MNTELKESEAQMAAEARLIERYPSEFDSIYAVVCQKRGIGMVTLSRTVYKTVTELDAITLVRHGWVRLDDSSL